MDHSFLLFRKVLVEIYVEYYHIVNKIPLMLRDSQGFPVGYILFKFHTGATVVFPCE